MNARDRSRIDHVALSRAMLLGRDSPAGRLGYALSMGTLLAATLGCAIALPSRAADILLADMSALVAVCSSAHLTATALRAQRLFAAVRAPGAAWHDWRRGWTQGQAILGAVLGGLALLVWAVRAPGRDELLMLPGGVVAAQALAVWGAFSFTGRWVRLRVVAVAAALLIVVVHEAGPMLLAALTPAGVGVLILAAGLVAFVPAFRALGPAGPLAARPARRLADVPLLGRLARLMRSMTPLSATHGAGWGRLWKSAAGNLVFVASQSAYGLWQLSSQWTRALPILWFTCLAASTLSAQAIHWRVQLRPGGPRRAHLGRHIFVSTLQVYALLLVPLLVVACVVGALLGAPPTVVAGFIWEHGHFFIDLPFSIALAVLLAGLVPVRWPPYLLVGALGILAYSGQVALTMSNMSNRGSRPPVSPDVVFGDDLALLALAWVCVMLADRAWSRRDLADLFRRQSQADRAR